MKNIKRVLAGAALAAALALPVLAPASAQAEGWHGWHRGWGWHGGVYIGVPRVVVTPAPYWHFIPGYYLPNGVWIPPHWGY